MILFFFLSKFESAKLFYLWLLRLEIGLSVGSRTCIMCKLTLQTKERIIEAGEFKTNLISKFQIAFCIPFLLDNLMKQCFAKLKWKDIFYIYATRHEDMEMLPFLPRAE